MGNSIYNKDDYLATQIFINSVIPLLKVIIQSRDDLNRKFIDKSFVFQISAKTEEDKIATHLVFDKGEITVKANSVYVNPDIELEFSNILKLNGFFNGKSKALPKFKGCIKHLSTFIGLLKALLLMAKLLGATESPSEDENKELLVKLYFYLLTNGISTLNKSGYKEIKDWTLASPDRAYAFAVTGYKELNSYIRIKEGNSKAGRGEYKRCQPFLTLRFDNPDHALDILLGKGDMIEYMSYNYLTVEGAPEFAGIIGDYMLLVGKYAQGEY